MACGVSYRNRRFSNQTPTKGGFMSVLKKVTQALCFLMLAAFAMLASAQERPPYGPAVNVATAKKIAAGALAEAQKNNWRVAIAVVDNHGVLVYYEMIDDTQNVSAQIAVDKAKAAAMYRRPTRAFVDAIAKGGPAIMTLPGVVAVPGGLPIMAGGKVIGGVGVSGVTGDQDEQIAKAGLAGM
jgi:glc operon protein GlcG